MAEKTASQRGRSARAKGAAFERQIANELNAELGVSLRRNLKQYQVNEEGDLVDDTGKFPFDIECKAYADGNGLKAAWWAQAVASSERSRKIPAVIYKYDRRPVRVAIPLATVFEDPHGQVIEMDLQTFTYIARELMNDD